MSAVKDFVAKVDAQICKSLLRQQIAAVFGFVASYGGCFNLTLAFPWILGHGVHSLGAPEWFWIGTELVLLLVGWPIYKRYSWSIVASQRKRVLLLWAGWFFVVWAASAELMGSYDQSPFFRYLVPTSALQILLMLFGAKLIMELAANKAIEAARAGAKDALTPEPLPPSLRQSGIVFVPASQAEFDRLRDLNSRT